MLKTTKEFTAAMRSDTRRIHAKVEIDGVKYPEDRIKTMSGDLGILSGSSFLIGSTYSNSVKIVFDSIIESIDHDQEVRVYLGIEVDHWEEPETPIQYVSMGKYYVEDFYRNRNSLETTVELSDGFLYMEKPYISKLGYPAEIRKVALEICNQAGIEVDEANFSRLSNQRIGKIEGATCREAIGYIAQFHSGFAHFNRDGKFEIRNLLTTNYEISDSDYLLKGLEVKEKPYSTDGIQVKLRQKDNTEEKILIAGATVGNIVELDNPVMTQSLLDEIWRQISSISFIPFEMEWRGNPQLEAGDWITIVDTEGRRFHVPQLLQSFDFNGGLKMKSSAQTTSGSSSIYKYRGSINQVIQFLEDQIAANGVNRIFHGSATPTDPREGDIWFKPNGPYTEMWIYEEDASGVLRWDLKVSTEPSKELLTLIDNAQKEAEKAITDANNARSIAEDAVARADNSAQAAADAKKVGEQAVENAREAQSTADTAVSNANQALDNIEGVDSKLTTEISRLDGSLSTKIEQTTFDKLKGLVDTQGTQISQNTTEIATKASHQEVNTISGRVDTHETRLTQNEKSIALKASQSTVDTLTGKVSVVETEISTIAGKFSALSSKVEGNTTKLGTLESSYDGLNSTVAVLQEDVLGKVDTIQFSNLSQKVDTLQLTVADKADKSQITVLTNQISSVVQDVEGNKSSINILKEDINLAVKKGDVINQINISPESILISGNKIRITGQTYIENAAIKSAAIASLDADRLTVGSTLNAAFINVINLNASNISTGYLSANRIASKSINADKINVTSLSAISSNIGTITAGSIKSVNISSATIEGGTIISPLFKVPEMETVVESTWDKDNYRTQMKFTKRGIFMVTYVWEYFPYVGTSMQYNIFQIELVVIRSQELYKEKWTGSGRGSSVENAKPSGGTTKRQNIGYTGTSDYSGPPREWEYVRNINKN
ncbi:hypothetical protein [Enterococcus pallens]|uniref:Phage minor structural protein n=1 Tax=Enterococcus pallens ATCC BAA-351 TaxID=1158607 RepID=R2SHU5_9ENTE|nr:hypothetical protein [Enterococcus pallens]EOH94850.1 hypothetical protein UAU_01772 [Enterococcus pallens ATCC BAA-351]EOU14831.1 hypothetical protein I588_04481 [Enterococcus pallens ATCC BAA-351]OJG76208.1 hypothetical protein RV10_GL004115 [Enterococcus pallens]